MMTANLHAIGPGSLQTPSHSCLFQLSFRLHPPCVKFVTKIVLTGITEQLITKAEFTLQLL